MASADSNQAEGGNARDIDLGWLQEEVGIGLQRLLALKLPGAPFKTEETLVMAQVWMDLILDSGVPWREELDRPRVHNAFKALALNAERWPAPKVFMDNLMPRVPTRLRLGRDHLTPEEVQKRAAGRQRLQEIAERYSAATNPNVLE